MTTFQFADLDHWAMKQTRVMDAIVKQSTNDTIVQSSRTATGVTRGGTRQRGYVPRDTGALAASLVSTLSGSTVLSQGNGAFNLVVGNMGAGDVATFAWTAPYARRMHYGDGTRQGWHWVTEVANDWPAIVAANIARAKAVVK